MFADKKTKAWAAFKAKAKEQDKEEQRESVCVCDSGVRLRERERSEKRAFCVKSSEAKGGELDKRKGQRLGQRLQEF